MAAASVVLGEEAATTLDSIERVDEKRCAEAVFREEYELGRNSATGRFFAVD